MGYYSSFELESVDGPEEIVNLFWADYTADRVFVHQWGRDTPLRELMTSDMKWYSCPEDMGKVSEEYPNVMFKVRVDGEESGDIWVLYARNGKTFRSEAQITFPEPPSDFAPLKNDPRIKKLTKKAKLQAEIDRLTKELEELQA